MLALSYLGVLLAVIALGFIVASLFRQVGVLHERSAPADALLERSAEADPSAVVLQRPNGDTVRFGELAGPMAALFVSPGCPVCEEVLAGCRELGAEPVVVASEFNPGDAWLAAAFTEQLYISLPLALALGVDRTPTLVGFDAELRTTYNQKVATAQEVQELMAQNTGDHYAVA